jgi:hypothetical protein
MDLDKRKDEVVKVAMDKILRLPKVAELNMVHLLAIQSELEMAYLDGSIDAIKAVEEIK